MRIIRLSYFSLMSVILFASSASAICDPWRKGFFMYTEMETGCCDAVDFGKRKGIEKFPYEVVKKQYETLLDSSLKLSKGLSQEEAKKLLGEADVKTEIANESDFTNKYTRWYYYLKISNPTHYRERDRNDKIIILDFAPSGELQCLFYSPALYEDVTTRQRDNRVIGSLPAPNPHPPY